MDISFDALTGRSIHRLITYKEKVWVHDSVLDDFLDLQKECRDQGYDLEIASGFRGYERQKSIWEEKVIGERPLYDREGVLVDIDHASESEILEALLAWSAIPGASRHHWGTDMDVYDKASFKDGKKLQLTIEEYIDPDGPCFEMNQFLESLHDPDFFRPYEKEGTGVQAEPWHYSHVKISKFYEQNYTKQIFKKNLETLDFSFAEEILKNIDSYFERFRP